MKVKELEAILGKIDPDAEIDIEVNGWFSKFNKFRPERVDGRIVMVLDFEEDGYEIDVEPT